MKEKGLLLTPESRPVDRFLTCRRNSFKKKAWGPSKEPSRPTTLISLGVIGISADLMVLGKSFNLIRYSLRSVGIFVYPLPLAFLLVWSWPCGLTDSASASNNRIAWRKPRGSIRFLSLSTPNQSLGFLLDYSSNPTREDISSNIRMSYSKSIDRLVERGNCMHDMTNF